MNACQIESSSNIIRQADKVGVRLHDGGRLYRTPYEIRIKKPSENAPPLEYFTFRMFQEHSAAEHYDQNKISEMSFKRTKGSLS